MGEFNDVLVPVSFEVVDPDATPPPEAIEVRTAHHVQVSRATIQALELAARLAKGGRVRLVHATPDLAHLSIYGGPEGSWFPVDSAQDLHRLTEHRSRAVLEVLAERHLSGAGVVEYTVAPGAPTTVILTAAERHRPDAIVLAASGRGALRRAFTGSTANKIIRQAQCPVIVIPRPPEPGPRASESDF